MSPDQPQALFGSEYAQALETWLQQRFRYLCGAYIALGAAYLVVKLFANPGATWPAWLIGVAGPAISVAIAAFYLTRRSWENASRDLVLMHATRMTLLLGATSIGIQLALVMLGAPFDGAQLLPRLFYWHVTACLFLPWTARESLRPMVPLMVVWAVCVVGFSLPHDFFAGVLTVIFGPGVLIPGLAICSWRLSRHSRQFRRRMVGQHFLSMRQELARARSIHESMFPRPYDDGHVRFDYTYLPMRELGGDFIHLFVGPEGLVHVSLIDVTGHGLAAALTVNRLYGELERIRGELPFAEPDEVLILLNRYINLTLVRHNIYATAALVTLDPYLGELRWAAGGHPPGFLREVSGRVEPLDATTVVLGALGDDEFSAEVRVRPIREGDELILYTDGVIEARNRAGDQYGLQPLRDLVHRNPPPRNWPQFVASTIQKYTAGRASDDILVASLRYVAARQDEHITDEVQRTLRKRTIQRVAEELT